LIISPALIALTLGSFSIVMIMIYASATGLQIVDKWDLSSGSEMQLAFERKTYLISTILNYAMGYEIFSLLMFVYTADHMHDLFIGAMCAAGSLNVNNFGYPTLVLKITSAIACGVWIIINYVDNKGYDYPLVKPKYKLLVIITSLIVLEGLFQWNYFIGLNPDIITSCCGIQFSTEAPSIAGEIAHLPSYSTKVLFFTAVVLTLRTGVYFFVTGRGARVFSYCALALFIISVISIISWISVHYYELPTHHCPFCVLQREYGYIGYPLYVTLFAAAITGVGVGVINRYRTIPSLSEIIPKVQKRLCVSAMISYIIFAAIAMYPMIFSDFKLEGY
jgi:hypothetical protein